MCKAIVVNKVLLGAMWVWGVFMYFVRCSVFLQQNTMLRNHQSLPFKFRHKEQIQKVATQGPGLSFTPDIFKVSSITSSDRTPTVRSPDGGCSCVTLYNTVPFCHIAYSFILMLFRNVSWALGLILHRFYKGLMQSFYLRSDLQDKLQSTPGHAPVPQTLEWHPSAANGD